MGLWHLSYQATMNYHYINALVLPSFCFFPVPQESGMSKRLCGCLALGQDQPIFHFKSSCFLMFLVVRERGPTSSPSFSLSGAIWTSYSDSLLCCIFLLKSFQTEVVFNIVVIVMTADTFGEMEGKQAIIF